MTFVVRLDLDYVPWDTPDARDYGHGEPAMIVRLLEVARRNGFKYHFFASNRTLRAFRSGMDSLLNEGHHLDWLCKRPDEFNDRFATAEAEFRRLGLKVQGMGVLNRSVWPPEFAFPESVRFVSGVWAAPAPERVRIFPTAIRGLRETVRLDGSARSWAESVKVYARQPVIEIDPLTLLVRPQVLAKADPKLSVFTELVDFLLSLDHTMATFRDLTAK